MNNSAFSAVILAHVNINFHIWTTNESIEIKY